MVMLAFELFHVEPTFQRPVISSFKIARRSCGNFDVDRAEPETLKRAARQQVNHELHFYFYKNLFIKTVRLKKRGKFLNRVMNAPRAKNDYISS